MFMSDLFLRVSYSISRYLYLNAHHLRIAIWDSRISIQNWNTNFLCHPSEKRHSIFWISFNSRLFFSFSPWWITLQFSSGEFLQSMSEVLQFRFGRLQGITRERSYFQKKNSIVKMSRKRCMFMIYDHGCLRMSCNFHSIRKKTFFFVLISWLTNQKSKDQ